MLIVEHWLRVSTWRRVHLNFYGGRFSAEAYEYLQLNNDGVQVAAATGNTPEDAIDKLGARLAELQR